VTSVGGREPPPFWVFRFPFLVLRYRIRRKATPPIRSLKVTSERAVEKGSGESGGTTRS